ncbi:DUF5993 family protein [Microbulbifer okhotskensis]|uniref:DUF5993 family protein n=1 Tax=Microbulbifer okhotskensis TaxID=2926617 RepID=UPI00359C19DE
MMSLIFLMYLAAMALAISNHRPLAIVTFVFVLTLSVAWLGFHSTDTLDILL